MLFESFESYFWKNDYPRHVIPYLKGKKVKHSLEILASLALHGSSTTRDMAKFTHYKSTEYPQRNLKGSNHISTLEKTYRRLILGIPIKSRDKRKIEKKYPGLLEQKFLDHTEKNFNSKNKLVQKYFLSLKGCFFALGFQFTDEQLSLFIKNAARNHLFFAYLNKIAEDTSIDYVNEWFLAPIKNLIRKGLLNLDYIFSLSIIYETIQNEFQNRIESLLESESEEEFEKGFGKLKYMEQKILKHTFYAEKPTSDWDDFVMEYFFPTEVDKEFLEFRNAELFEIILLYKIMKSVHFGYSIGLQFDVPAQTQKIPYSKRWKIFKKENSQYKSPYDYDRKKHQIVDYSAGYIVS